VLIAVFASFLSVAWAQDAAFDIERFRPAVDPYGYASVESAQTLNHLQLGVGMWGNFADDPLILTIDGVRYFGDGTNKDDGVIDIRSTVDFQFGLGLSSYFSLNVDMPVVLWQEGNDIFAIGGPDEYRNLQSYGPGDLRIAPKISFLDSTKNLVGIAIQAQVGIPTGWDTDFIAARQLSVMPMGIIEFADGSVSLREYRFRAAINVGGWLRPAYQVGELSLGSELIYRVGISGLPTEVLELGAELYGGTAGPSTSQQPLEMVSWFRLIPLDWVTVTAGGGVGALPGVGAPDYRLFLGATIAPSFDPSTLDRDHDGVPNRDDKCINIPEDRDGFEDEDGCPERDNDGDGIDDALDRCPNDPEDIDNYEDGDGCPDVDNDRDGFLDVEDRCPNRPENLNNYQDEDGCPDVIPIGDTDGDGLTDDVDRCPYDAEDLDTFEDEDGCPDPDNDFDGVLDAVDECPFEKETYNGVEDEDGCPDEAAPRVIVEKARIKITDNIYFETASSEIKIISYELMNEIVAVVKAHPELLKIRIEGHTDNVGDDLYNLKLSQSRAESVAQFLIDAGVESGRLDPAGFGEARPISTNDTNQGRSENRRVEFLIIERE
jgi:outer membrane protein OmpA-like peptidoglycan-associated protein